MLRFVLLIPLVSFAGCQPTTSRNAKLPVDLSYPVIKEWDDQTRRGVDIRLNMKVLPEVLREIALEVKSQETRQYHRTLIHYYLPQYDPAARDEMWAKSDFDPTLKVEILGSDIETEAKARTIPTPQSGGLFDPWFIDDQLGCRKVLIFENAGTIKRALFFTQGERFDSELIELPSTVGRRFRLKAANDELEVDANGVLRVYGSEERLLSASPPLK